MRYKLTIVKLVKTFSHLLHLKLIFVLYWLKFIWKSVPIQLVKYQHMPARISSLRLSEMGIDFCGTDIKFIINFESKYTYYWGQNGCVGFLGLPWNTKNDVWSKIKKKKNMLMVKELYFWYIVDKRYLDTAFIVKGILQAVGKFM